jgi:hypothetical protein
METGQTPRQILAPVLPIRLLIAFSGHESVKSYTVYVCRKNTHPNVEHLAFLFKKKSRLLSLLAFLLRY